MLLTRNCLWGEIWEKNHATYRAVSSAGRKSNDPRQQVARRPQRCCRVSARRPKTLIFNIFHPLNIHVHRTRVHYSFRDPLLSYSQEICHGSVWWNFFSSPIIIRVYCSRNVVNTILQMYIFYSIAFSSISFLVCVPFTGAHFLFMLI